MGWSCCRRGDVFLGNNFDCCRGRVSVGGHRLEVWKHEAEFKLSPVSTRELKANIDIRILQILVVGVRPKMKIFFLVVLTDAWRVVVWGARWFFRSPPRGTKQQSMAGFLSFVGTNLTFTVVAVFQLHRPYLDRQKNFSPKDRTRNSFRPKEFWLLNLRSFRSFVRSEMRYKPCDESFYTSLVRRKS